MSFDEAMQQGEVALALEELERELQLGREPGKLFMLFELKALLEDFDAAAAALDEIGAAQPTTRPLLDDMRACLACERQRAARRSDATAAGKRSGLGPPQPFQLGYLKAAALLAQGDKAGSLAALTEAQSQRPKTPGTLARRGGSPLDFDDLSDSDDLIGGVLEAIGPQGALDVPFCELRTIVFHPAQGFQDTLWVPAELQTRSGKSLATRIPSLYSGSGKHPLSQVRLGAVTLWDHGAGFARGMGQRDLKLTTGADATLVGIRQVARIDFVGPEAIAAKKPGFWQRVFG